MKCILIIALSCLIHSANAQKINVTNKVTVIKMIPVTDSLKSISTSSIGCTLSNVCLSTKIYIIEHKHHRL